MVRVTRLAHDDTRGLVALRARDPSHVVVAFRGTASASQISTNADVRLKRIVTPSAPDEPPPPPVLRSESSLEDDDEPAGNGRLGLDLLVRTAAVAVDVTARGGDLLQDFARGLLNASGAVDVAPGLASTVEPCVHNGFWTAYAGVRPQLERALSEALATNEVRRVSFTGHSLGGALAQLASADFASGALCPTHGRRADCVTFGAPRVGNAVWARAFSKLVPEAWRVVCDGDVIAFLRGCGYVHAGVEVVVDASAQTPGYVVVDPTPVEKKLRLGCGKSVGAQARGLPQGPLGRGGVSGRSSSATGSALRVSGAASGSAHRLLLLADGPRGSSTWIRRLGLAEQPRRRRDAAHVIKRSRDDVVRLRSLFFYSASRRHAPPYIYTNRRVRLVARPRGGRWSCRSIFCISRYPKARRL